MNRNDWIHDELDNALFDYYEENYRGCLEEPTKCPEIIQKKIKAYNVQRSSTMYRGFKAAVTAMFLGFSVILFII